MTTTVRWAELLPREFLARQEQLPLVYLPWACASRTGTPPTFGLDTLKDGWLCEKAARRFGGVVAPTQDYQIHETGLPPPVARRGHRRREPAPRKHAL